MPEALLGKDISRGSIGFNSQGFAEYVCPLQQQFRIRDNDEFHVSRLTCQFNNQVRAYAGGLARCYCYSGNRLVHIDEIQQGLLEPVLDE